MTVLACVLATTFTTGVTAAVHAAAPASATPLFGFGQVRIDKAYVINKTSYDNWDNTNASAPPPVPRNVFTISSRYVGIYFTYSNAKVGKDTFQFALFTTGNTLLAKGKLRVFHAKKSAEALLLPVQTTLTHGVYKAAVFLDGKAAITLPWQVR